MALFDRLKERLVGPAGQGQGFGGLQGALQEAKARYGGAQGQAPAPAAPPPPAPSSSSSSSKDPDEAAVERYRYMLRTAPPETVEQAHAEAFAKLTPEQRQKVLAGLSEEAPPAERATSDDPRALARMATRAEMSRPGTMERVLGGRGGGRGGMGMGGVLARGLLAGVAGAFVGTAVAGAFLEADGGFGAEAADPGVEDPGGGDVGGDFGGDFGGEF